MTRFLAAHPRYTGWQIEKVAIAPTLTPEVRERIVAAGHLAQDLTDLTAELR